MSDHDRLFSQSVLMMAATQVGNVANVAFQIVMMHSLSPAEYGALAAMFGLILIVVTPLEALRTAWAHFAAGFAQAGTPGLIRPLVRIWGRNVFLGALCVLSAAALLAVPARSFFQLPTAWLVPLTGLALAEMLFMPLLTGVLQGVQSFGRLAIVGQAWGLARLAMGVVLVAGVCATALMGLVAQCAGIAVSLLLGVWALRTVLPPATTAVLPTGGRLGYFGRSLAILCGYAVLMNADVSLVKHYFAPETAGVFAKAATIARAIVFLPMPIAAVMFPKVVSNGARAGSDHRTFLRSLSYTAGVVLVAGLAACAGAPYIWRVLANEIPQPETVALVRAIVGALAPLALAYLVMNYELAQRRFAVAWLLAPCALLYVVGVAVWHASLGQVVSVMACVNGAALACLLAGVPWRRAEIRPGSKPVLGR